MSARQLVVTLSLVAVVACAGETSRTPSAPPLSDRSAAIVSSTATAASTSPSPSEIADSSAGPTASAVAEVTQASPSVLAPVVMPDVDYWATPQPIVDKMLELARVKASDVVYDLGCGDARSLVTAAERYGAKGVGFDIDPHVVAMARQNVRRHGVESLVHIEQANMFKLDLSEADVIFLYITPRFNLRMVPQFEKMRRGSRIVSHEFEIPGAKPTRTLKVSGPCDGPPDAQEPAKIVQHTIYLWRMPWTRVWTNWKAE